MTAPPTLPRRIEAALRGLGLLGPRHHLLLAVSGGADSVALACAISGLARARRPRLTLAHLHHGIRGRAADLDARFVQELAWRLGWPCHVSRADVPARARQTGESLEMAARAERRAFLAGTARAVGAEAIVLAHTRDDQVETVLMRLARGAGARGLAGMSVESEVMGLRLVRPMLALDRAMIEAFLRAHRLAWREDASNRDRSIRRNLIRHEILPLLAARLNPRIRDALARTSAILRDENDWMDRAAARAAAGAAGPAGDLDAARLGRLHPALARRVVVAWLHAHGTDAEAVDYDAVDRVLALARGASPSGRADVGGGRQAARRGGRIRLSAAGPVGAAAELPSSPVQVPGVTDAPALGLRLTVRRSRGFRRVPPSAPGALPARCWIGAAASAGLPWILRAARRGDRVRLLGAPGSRKLSDILIDAKVPAECRAGLAVLEIGGAIAWIPGLRIAEGRQVPAAASPSWEVQADYLGNP